MNASASAAAARRARVLLAPTLLLSLGGCAVNWSERTTGTAIGAVGGGVAGGLLGSAVGSTVGGAILGSAAGAAAGYIIGDYLADRRERNAWSGGTPTANAPRPPSQRTRGYGDPEDSAPPSDLGPVVPAPAEDVVARSAPGDAVPVAASETRASRHAAARREYEAGRRSKTDAEALAHYDAAMRIDPSRPEPHNARGLVLLHMGRRADARRAFAQSVAVDPSYAAARANLDRLDRARSNPPSR